MTITEIRNKDYEPLRNLFLNERQRTFSWLDPSEFQLDDFEKHIQGETVLVALENDIPIGFISIWMPNNFIHHLYIDQEHQGKNIGTELLKAAIKKTKFPVTLKCLEQNSKAVDFYKRKGFVEKEKGNSEHGTYILFELLENIH
ncbi:GNAT family N-acetyltransferase [Flavobacterium sp. LC2016-01]|uniref:GNAT family N-acetyltransferase n=1 Tax=Flavobacterium sp. LC2016-01 TaxID=2675876 RepID=UPI0012BA698F|nr:GNAT family N-acetyltransferase [Flavobacterium sp. LC2016-01]MTH15486.1 GNAT family N-acetyltransferase [Flavobacterium sp. LC2016-01]